DLRERAALGADDLRLLVKVGALDGVAGGCTRPQLLWAVDTAGSPGPLLSSRAQAATPPESRDLIGSAHEILRLRDPSGRSARDDNPLVTAPPPPLRDYPPERQRQDAWALLGFCLDTHP